MGRLLLSAVVALLTSFACDAIQSKPTYGGSSSPLAPPPTHHQTNEYTLDTAPTTPASYTDEGAFNTDFMEQQQTVEERAAAWRKSQLERYEHQTAEQKASATDEDGRMKLMASVSRGSISFFFFILMWRAVHHYELADQSRKGLGRLLLVIPAVALFIGNMAGCVASVTSPSQSAKKRMKAILNLNKLVEFTLFVYNVLRLTVFPSKFTTREIYVGRTLTNFIFLVQCQLFTKVTWGATPLQSGAPQYYDSFQTNMAGGQPQSFGYGFDQAQNLNRGEQPASEYRNDDRSWN